VTYRNETLNYWGKVSDGDLSVMGTAVEKLVWLELKKNIKLKTFELTNGKTKWTARGLALKNVRELKNEKGFPLRPSIEDLQQTIFDPSKNTVCWMKEKCPLIDFAGPGRRVYQVTVGTDHEFKLDGTKELLCAGGFIEVVGGVIAYSEAFDNFLKGTEEEKKRDAEKWYIEFYWTVPESISKTWIKKCPKRFQQDTAEKRIVLTCLRYVKQFVLVMMNNKANYLNMEKDKDATQEELDE
jgi:hypothetical protein